MSEVEAQKAKRDRETEIHQTRPMLFCAIPLSALAIGKGSIAMVAPSQARRGVIQQQMHSARSGIGCRHLVLDERDACASDHGRRFWSGSIDFSPASVWLSDWAGSAWLLGASATCRAVRGKRAFCHPASP